MVFLSLITAMNASQAMLENEGWIIYSYMHSLLSHKRKKTYFIFIPFSQLWMNMKVQLQLHVCIDCFPYHLLQVSTGKCEVKINLQTKPMMQSPTIVTKDFTILGLTRERKEIDHDFSSTFIGCKIHENPLLSWLSDFWPHLYSLLLLRAWPYKGGINLP